MNSISVIFNLTKYLLCAKRNVKCLTFIISLNPRNWQSSYCHFHVTNEEAEALTITLRHTAWEEQNPDLKPHLSDSAI